LQVKESAVREGTVRQAMTKLEMVEVALTMIGPSSSDAIASFIEKEFGVVIEPKYMPVYRASLLGRQLLTSCRGQKAPRSATTPQVA
jgi:hypothetical protein